MKPRLKKFSRKLIVADLIASVRAVTAAHPDHIYHRSAGDRCLYKPTKANDFMGCIIGEGLRKIGFSTRDLEDQSIDSHLEQLKMGTLQERGWLELVQCAQDLGDTWGKCLDEADTKRPV